MADSPNYEKFNYTLRPAKSIERKIIVDSILAQLTKDEIDKCTFVSLGSVFFSDFIIFRKKLKLNNMISIEANEDDRVRFMFNKPFGNIDLRMGHTNKVLPELEWDSPYIIWLDYEDCLKPYMFDDLETIFNRIKPNSYFIFTCNSQFHQYESTDKKKFDRFCELFSGKVPHKTTQINLQNANAPILIEKMVLNFIDSKIKVRNLAFLPKSEELYFLKDATITYKDGARMFSIFGAIKNGTYAADPNCHFISSSSNKILDIQNPILTQKEIHLLNRYIHLSKEKFEACKWIRWIPKDHKMAYYQFFQYYANYVESSNH